MAQVQWQSVQHVAERPMVESEGDRSTIVTCQDPVIQQERRLQVRCEFGVYTTERLATIRIKLRGIGLEPIKMLRITSFIRRVQRIAYGHQLLGCLAGPETGG